MNEWILRTLEANRDGLTLEDLVERGREELPPDPGLRGRLYYAVVHLVLTNRVLKGTGPRGEQLFTLAMKPVRW